MPYVMTAERVIAVLLVYASLFVLIRMHKKSIDRSERKTFWFIALVWAVSVFGGNIMLARMNLMSPLPIVNNFMHTFLWIGLCLAWLYLGIRDRESMVVQFIAFATFSLVVKVFEHQLFGTWDHDHFFHIFRGNAAYILGWSLADGLYPPLTLFGLRLVKRHISGLIVA